MKYARSNTKISKPAQRTELASAHSHVIEDFDLEQLSRPDEVPRHFGVR